jgi:hypothetical protein
MKYGPAVCAALLAMTIGSAARAGDIAKCEDAVAKGSRNVGNQEQKKNRKCVKDGSGDVDACVDAEGAKAAIKRTKLQDLYAVGGKCEGVAAQVNGDPDDIADGTEEAAGNILRGAFGDPVDGIVAESKCHDKIAKRAGKKFDTELKAFRACVKDATPLTQVEVDNCVATGVNDSKAQDTVQPKLEADMLGQCSFASPPAGLEDGDCSTCTDAATCADCIGDIVDCQACEAMNNSNNANANCDDLDDGIINGSCSAPIACPLSSGEYTVTQTVGGTLTVSIFAPFPFPTGGTIVMDTGAGDADCVHDLVVPFPGGFTAPTFCVPALGFTVHVEQTGCGIGQIDSDGGSDYTIDEKGDSSDGGVCPGTDQSGVACATFADSSQRVDITVGNAAADICGGGGTANVITSIPVFTVTWTPAGPPMCPDPDGTFDAGTDTLVTEFPQTLDFTTDTNTAAFVDLDADLCKPGSGLGPDGPYMATGACLNIGGGTVTTGAAGTVASSGSPAGDLLFSTTLPNTFAASGPFSGAACGSPPVLPLPTGSATRCFVAP